MANTGADIKADIGADGKELPVDRKEPVSLMEPLLIAEGSRFRGELTDLAVELAARRAITALTDSPPVISRSISGRWRGPVRERNQSCRLSRMLAVVI